MHRWKQSFFLAQLDQNSSSKRFSGRGAGRGPDERLTRLPPEYNDAAVAEVAPARHDADLRAGNLRRTGLTAKLAGRLDDVVETPYVRLDIETEEQ